MLFLILLCLWSFLSFSTEVEVYPYDIFFDYDHSSHQHDALSVSDENGDLVTSAEWHYFDQISNPAYIEGEYSRRIKVCFASDNYTDIAHLIIRLSYASGSSNGIGTLCNFFIPNYDLAIGQGNAVELQLTGGLPLNVGKQEFTWKWEIYAIPVNESGYSAAWTTTNTTHTYYRLFSEPIAPMEEPWTSVLDKACSWAQGKTTIDNTLSELVIRLYNDDELDYNPNQSHYIEENGAFVFNLSGILESWHYVDCQDCSMLLSILSSSLGLPLNQTRRLEGDFTTNEIDPIGLTYSEAEYSWAFHQIDWNNYVYDPTIMYGYSIPTKMTITAYQDAIRKTSWWGIYNPFILGQTDPYYNEPTSIE